VALSLIVDRTGSYGLGFLLLTILSFAAALLIFGVRPLYRDRLRAAANP